MRILLLENNPTSGHFLRSVFDEYKFETDWFYHYRQGEAALKLIPYSAIILGSMPVETDRIERLLSWRKNQLTFPVLVISEFSDATTRAKFLNSGADDCLDLSTEPAELIARIHVIIRRSHKHATPILKHQEITFDTASRQAKNHGQILNLTNKETTLLEVFLLNKTRVLSRTHLCAQLYSWHRDVTSNSVEVHIHNLRKKLGKDFILTIRGVGYRLRDTPDDFPGLP